MRLGGADGTLLGPEGTTVGPKGSWLGLSERQVPPGRPYQLWEQETAPRFGGWLWVVGWLLVENCTVDASILFSVVKLSRANGGCLGTRSR